MKRTLMQRLARNIDTNDPTKCWSWTGRVTLVTETLRPHYNRKQRRLNMAVERASPLIQVNGKRQSPARLMYEIVTGNTLPPTFTLRRNKRLCADRLCINPHHRIPPGGETLLPPVEEPRQLEYTAAPDDITDLIDLMHDHQSRHASVEELREAMGGDFTIAEYEQAFEREPELKKDLIREGSNP